MRKQVLTIVFIALAAIAALSASVVYGAPYFSSPDSIRQPVFDHYHFRTQLVVGGQVVNFAEAKFQETTPGVCSEEITESPVHFHDYFDQITHIHWDGITGGQVLKYYGWNFIGGRDDSLGARFDKGVLPANVPILGKLLPAIPEGANFYIYTGDQNEYHRRDWDKFLSQDLEYFFGKKIQLVRAGGFDLSGLLFKKASAHAGHDHSTDVVLTDLAEPGQEQLEQINNLIGNVAIFVQSNEPTDQQVKDRFNSLVPLQNSTCGG